MDVVGKKTLEIMKAAKFYNRWLLGFFKPHLSGNILEIGSGIGNFTSELTKLGEITATDIDKYYINKLKKVLKPASVAYADIEKADYSFGTKKFNSIVCLNVLEHIEQDTIALKNMHSLLKTNGKLVLIVPAHQFAYTKIDKDLGHFRRYTVQSLKSKAIEVGFNIVQIRYLNILGLVGWFINGKLLRKKVIPRAQLKIFDKVSAPLLLLEKKLKFPIGLSVLLVAQKK